MNTNNNTYDININELFLPLFEQIMLLKQGKKCKIHYFYFIGGRSGLKTSNSEKISTIGWIEVPDLWVQVLRGTDKEVKKQKGNEYASLINSLGLIKGTDYNYVKGDMEFTNLYNNNKIILDSLNAEDYPAEEGAKLDLPILPQNIKAVINFYDEANQLSKALVDQHILSTRNNADLEKLIIMCSNPWTADNWYISECEKLLPPNEYELEHNGFQAKIIPEYKDGAGLYILRTNYRINRYISKQDIAELETVRQLDYEQYKIVGLGMSGSMLETIYRNCLAKAKAPITNNITKHGRLFGGVDVGWTASETSCELANVDLYQGIDVFAEKAFTNNGLTAEDYKNKKMTTRQMIENVIDWYASYYYKYKKPITVFVDNASYPDFYEQFNSCLANRGITQSQIQFLPAKKQGEHYNIGFRVEAVRYALAAGMLRVNKELTPRLWSDLYNCAWEKIKTWHEDSKPKRTHQFTHYLNALEMLGCEVWYHFRTMNSYYFSK